MEEKIAKQFENAMKTGFISSLILNVLEKNPSYGYKIGKDIEKRTLGIWDPPSSTMYTVLKDMTKKQLISFRVLFSWFLPPLSIVQAILIFYLILFF